MIFRETPISGAYLIDLTKFEDERGFFARAWCQKEFLDHGIIQDLVQCNLSYSTTRGTLRGMHYQTSPHQEAKLVRCIRGAIFDAIIDLRQGSPTFEEWYGVKLSAKNRRMLYVPEGCAHGFQTIEDGTEVFYQVSEFYAPEAERGIRWDDPFFGLSWPVQDNMIISEKDRNWPNYRTYTFSPMSDGELN